MPAEPDLDGLPEGLRATVEKALAKSPGERITSDSAAEECARFLSTQATQVLTVDARLEPVGAPDFVATEWHVPSVEDPAWQDPTASDRKRPLIVFVAAAAAGAAIAAGILAFDAKGQVDPDAKSKSTVSPAAPSGTPAAITASISPGATRTAPPVDPRTIRIPMDPLAGVPHPAYTRAGDESQPHPNEWRTSTRAVTPEEQDAEQAIRDHMTSMLATKDMDFMKPTITFNQRAQTVIVTGGPVPQLPENYQDVFRRAGQMAACTALAQRLKGNPATWPYGRFTIRWKTSDGDIEAPAIGYGEATNGCFTEIAGQWHGDEEGMATAELPSSDKEEIRVADATVKAITATWNANTSETNEAPLSTGDGINLGFDPVENAAYVWTDDPNNHFASRASQSNLKGAIEEAVCRKLAAEFNSNKSWNYTRWTVAVHNAYTNDRQFIDSGTCTP
ncbi:hypothetical protein [Streptomyces sp. AP-93]|uniref:hypothetical protein n=1 Tax=Streptomyces sp. AP-93 TaxID=2929048 RepID=UPI001FAF0BCD|nr:hypothetical protein [Streptomyces sp. AP-93]MCJ0874309.1 hypothetical protein [Streptomyces sp. AP-93]